MALMHRLRRDVTTTDDVAQLGAAPAWRPGATRLAPATHPAVVRPAISQSAAGRTTVRPSVGRTTVSSAHGGRTAVGPAHGGRAAGPSPSASPSALPPSVARVAARTRLSAELLAAILEVDARRGATLDDIERADALAERLLARRADRQRAAAVGRPVPAAAGARLAG